jgi:asparagine N-glycosylation enzyme membrane subunit Stt3
VAYIAKAVGFVFHMPGAEALDAVCKFLPPVLGIISLVVVYLAAARAFDRRVAAFAALAWAMLLPAVFIGAAGYIDRDGLTVFLLMSGAFAFYAARGWQVRVGNRDMGWVLAGLLVLLIEGLLYVEWSFAGPVLLMAVVVVYSIVQMLIGYIRAARRKQTQAKDRLAGAADEVNWRALGLVVGGNVVGLIVLAALDAAQLANWWHFAVAMVRGGGQATVQEMQRLRLADLLVYNVFLIPMVVCLYLAFKKRSNAYIFFTTWFLCLLILSLFAKRILLFAVPAASVLAGAGLAGIWEWQSAGRLRRLRKVGVALLLFLLVLVSSITAYGLGNPQITVDDDWLDALAFIRETSSDSTVMTQWSWGYWILDLGQRTPFVDNGYYGHPPDRLREVGVAYATTDPAQAAQIMQGNGVDYLVFCERDKGAAPSILKWAGLDKEYDTFPNDSLFAQTMSGEFTAGGGLEVVHRSAPNSEVVVLGLSQDEHE